MRLVMKQGRKPARLHLLSLVRLGTVILSQAGYFWYNVLSYTERGTT